MSWYVAEQGGQCMVIEYSIAPGWSCCAGPFKTEQEAESAMKKTCNKVSPTIYLCDSRDCPGCDD